MAGAGYKDFSAGAVLLSSEVDTYLMEQSIMVFASAAARDTAITAPAEGMNAYLSDVNMLCQYSGSAWVGVGPTNGAWRSYTPTYSNITVGNGTVTSRYMRIGRMITYKWQFSLGSTSAIGTNPTFAVPVTAAAQGELDMNVCRFTDNSPFTRYMGWAVGATTSTVEIGQIDISGLSTTLRTSITATSPFTWASGDSIFVTGTYEASADAL